jgi:hypothetical protein
MHFFVIQLTCETCTSLVDTFLSWINAGDSREVIVEKYVEICTTMNIFTPSVCRATVEMRVVSKFKIIVFPIAVNLICYIVIRI